MGNLIWLIIMALNLYALLLLARAFMTWLPNLDYSNPIVKFLIEATEPVLRPIRQAVPPVNGLDLSTMIAIIGIYLITNLIGFIF